MHSTVQLDSIFVALAVLLFVLFAIAVLVIIDHKARIPDGEKRDLFSISGIRRDHPVWAWGVSAILWLIIGGLLGSAIFNMASKVVPEKKAEAGTMFTGLLDKEHLAERVRHFHNSPKTMPWSDGTQPVCYSCHGEFPHSKKPMVRTLLNMHTQFAGCMTCHTDSKKVPEEQLALRWLNYSGIQVKGKPFGTDVNPQTGDLAETDDYYSKIVAYVRNPDGTEKLVEVTADDPQAREYLAMRGSLSTQQQGVVKKMFHATVNPVGRFCTRCHTQPEESYIPFRELGFSERRVTALTNLNIVGIVEKYREFYIPSIFHDGVTEAERNVLVGTSKPPQEVTEDMRKDPRAWWRKMYGTEESK